MRIKLNNESIRYITLFESMTSALVKDCIISEAKLMFIVDEGQAGVAIGKNGLNIKNLENVLKKKIEIVEFSNDPLKFLQNILRPFSLKNLYMSEKSSGKKAIYFSVQKTSPLLLSKIKKAKPLIIAGNKIDVPEAQKNLRELSDTEIKVIPCSAEAELALRKAKEEGDITYEPGDQDFEIIKEDLEEKKKAALEFIKEKIIKEHGSTGVQQVLDSAVFELLNMIVVYPVENESHCSSKKGDVLPDAYIVPKGRTSPFLLE